MAKNSILDFNAQADQMMEIIESRMKAGKKDAATQFLVLKFKTLFEQGVASGREWERRGVSPYESLHTDFF